MTKELTQAAPKVRPKRTPIASRNILTVVGKDPTKTYRFVNNTDDRIEAFKDAGYELVQAKDVRVGDRRVDGVSAEGSYAQVSVGNGQKAFLMAISNEWYEEDQKVKQAKVDDLERSTKQQALAQNELKNGKLVLERD